MTARARRIRLLQAAHAGERTASLTYAGNWRSVCDPEERAAIRCIEADAWEHRRCLGRMLTDLGAKPAPLLEMRLVVIGGFIRTRVADHWGLRWLRPWPELPPREALRALPEKAA